MGKIFVTLILIFTGVILSAFTIPFSQTELKTDVNHLSEFVRISPDDSLAIPLQTDVWLWHDKECLFIHWEVEVNESFEKGRLANTDEWIECDKLRIQIITDVNNYYTYFFYSNPFGNIYDGIRGSDMSLDTAWNSNYKYENNISDNIWISTMQIPIKDLRFYGKPPYEWKIILTRYFEKTEDYYSIPFGKIEMGKDYFRKAFDIVIKEELSQTKNYRITPYLIKKYDLLEETDFFDLDNVGLDFSYNPTSATKVKISINPDFSNIPLDSEVDNTNVRYAPYFSENRYFFIEDLDVFGVSSNLFYSRHIMQPQYAVKLTGNSENYSYGFLSAMDKKVIEEDETLNSDDIYNMLAFKPKWEDIFIQMTLLNRMNKDYHNEMLMIKPSWEFKKNHSVWSEVNYSIKEMPGSDYESGYAMYCGYNGKKKDFNINLTCSQMSKDFNADMGRIYLTDFSAINIDVFQETEPNGKFVKKFGSGFWLNRSIINGNKELDGQNAGLNFWANSPYKISFSINTNIGQENYEDSIYDWDFFFASIGNWSLSWLSARISYSSGNSIVYSLSKTYRNDNVWFSLWGDIGSNVSYSTSVQKQRYFDFPDDCGMDNEYWIGNTDITINFSNLLSLSNGFRFNNYESNNLTSYIGVFSNLRFEFKDNCNLYVGYKSAQDEIGEEYITDYKQAYMKVSYTF
ncbi:MAG: hypothetical protein DRI23_05145 [Candidatus Cloacimonadota bacterium]|nr:MAG: hypothetical protein DRI23_05145 [Candidatus Cloacimonadota bacterium]